MQKTIILTEDNTLDPEIDSVCKRILKREAGDHKIICVSQKPVDIEKNIVLDIQGKNWLNLYKQLLAGAEAADTEYVAVAEHDCLYTKQHFDWDPPTKDTFYYNSNLWIVQWGGEHAGVYTFWPKRLALSQLICSRDLLIESIRERLYWLNEGYVIQKGRAGAGEPGICEKGAIETQLEAAYRRATSGRPVQLHPQMKSYLKEYPSKSFYTENPNLDIRHKGNFTGPKRGKIPTKTLPFWGEFNNVIKWQ